MHRHRVELNGAWLFRLRGDEVAVTLPHCWNVDDTFVEGVDYYRGRGTYRCTFTLPEREFGRGQWFLRSEGFYGRASVELNGRKIGKVDGAYLGFCIDVSEGLDIRGENRLTITLSNRHHRHTLPGIKDPDFILYGGLTGRVWLEWRPALRFDDDSVFIRSDTHMLTIAWALHGAEAANADHIEVRWQVLSADGVPVVKLVGADGVATVDDVLRFKKWDVDNPVLYTAVGTLSINGEPVDEVRKRFGVRTIEFRRGEGFLLNGRRIEIRGCNRHQGMPGYGAALPPDRHRQDVEIIKKMGLNAVRLAHYPQPPAFLDACDELGILVYAEIATWKSVTTGKWLDAAERQLRGMMLRDRNHPCIILWGLGNESRSRVAYERLNRVAHALDPDRFTIYAENHLDRAKRQNALNLVDVWGCNYELEVLDEAADYCATGVTLVSECANSPHAVRGDEAMEQDQVARISRDLDTIAAHPSCAGFFIWSFQDYATLRKRRYKRHCGLVDAWRRPKKAALMLEERFAQAPVNRFVSRNGSG